MVHGEDVFAFLDACFDQLASIVALKPARQIGGNRITTEVNERGVALGLAGVETFQGDIEGIRKVGEAFVFPGDHLGIAGQLGSTVVDGCTRLFKRGVSQVLKGLV